MQLQRAIHSFIADIDELCKLLQDRVRPLNETERKALRAHCEMLLEELDRQQRDQH
jgi:hypothetical protein